MSSKSVDFSTGRKWVYNFLLLSYRAPFRRYCNLLAKNQMFHDPFLLTYSLAKPRRTQLYWKPKLQKYLEKPFSELYYILIYIIWPVAETVSVVFAIPGSDMSVVWSIDEVVVSGKTVDWLKSVHYTLYYCFTMWNKPCTQVICHAYLYHNL